MGDWEGDLRDNCWLTRDGYRACAEAMRDGGEGWHCSVVDPDGKMLFHSGDADILPLTGDAARLLASLVVRAELARHRDPSPG